MKKEMEVKKNNNNFRNRVAQKLYQHSLRFDQGVLDTILDSIQDYDLSPWNLAHITMVLMQMFKDVNVPGWSKRLAITQIIIELAQMEIANVETRDFIVKHVPILVDTLFAVSKAGVKAFKKVKKSCGCIY
jgi:hypothetical protein